MSNTDNICDVPQWRIDLMNATMEHFKSYPKNKDGFTMFDGEKFEQFLKETNGSIILSDDDVSNEHRE